MGLFRKATPLDNAELPPLRAFSITSFPVDKKAQIRIARKNGAKDGEAVKVAVVAKRSPIAGHADAIGVFAGTVRVGSLYGKEKAPVEAMLKSTGRPVPGVLEIWIGGQHHTVARPHLRLHCLG